MKRLVILLPVLLAFQVGVQPALAWTWPVEGPVLRPFILGENPYAGGQHRGIDIGAPTGTSVRAPAGGTVSFAGTVPTGGRTLTIRTSDGYSVTLLHLGTIGAVRGASVSEGDPVGTVGPSGVPELPEPYVYLGIRVTSDPNGYVDPVKFLPAASAPAPAPAPAPALAPAPAPDSPPTAATTPPGETQPVGNAHPAAAPQVEAPVPSGLRAPASRTSQSSPPACGSCRDCSRLGAAEANAERDCAGELAGRERTPLRQRSAGHPGRAGQGGHPPGSRLRMDLDPAARPRGCCSCGRSRFAPPARRCRSGRRSARGIPRGRSSARRRRRPSAAWRAGWSRP